MKIGLVSCLMKDNNIEHQLSQIEYYVSNNKTLDLICFGESFLQGFQGLTWNYEEDIKRALDQKDNKIKQISKIAEKYRCGISFGFIEKVKGSIYSSNMVIDHNGKIIDVYQRVSPGWKEPIANSKYKEGNKFQTFNYKGKDIGVAICGDIWDDGYLKELEKMKMDVLLWPLYIDYQLEEWESEQFEYAKRVKGLNYPILMINSYVKDFKRVNGGCYIFYQNKIYNSLKMGNIGVLEFEIK